MLEDRVKIRRTAFVLMAVNNIEGVSQFCVIGDKIQRYVHRGLEGD